MPTCSKRLDCWKPVVFKVACANHRPLGCGGKIVYINILFFKKRKLRNKLYSCLMDRLALGRLFALYDSHIRCDRARVWVWVWVFLIIVITIII